ncbi:MAG: rhomboid family intramembrane serine protease [Rhodobacteraceae bacterium]|nr:rhomboid family intramembrane serine protease [Paracoccaceae bacterium]
MFPIRDHNPSERAPIVTYGLIAINIVIFLSYYPELAGNPRHLARFYDEWGLIPIDLLYRGDVLPLLTSMFLHGGWMHIIGNMLFLWIFGDNLEDLLGHFGFLLFYLASGLAAGLGQVIAAPQSSIPMVGASGAIAGVMGGYLLMFPRARIDVLVILVVIIRIFTIPAWLMLGMWFGLQLVNGLATDATGGGVAYWAHAGGFIAGVLFMLPVWSRCGATAYWREFHGKPPHAEVEYRVTRRSGIPRVQRLQAPRGQDTRPLGDLGRVPRSGVRRYSSSPWSGGRK